MRAERVMWLPLSALARGELTQTKGLVLSLVPQGAIASCSPSLDTLFIGWPIDYVLLRNIHRNLVRQLQNRKHGALTDYNFH